jgi:hypothetical protein
MKQLSPQSRHLIVAVVSMAGFGVIVLMVGGEANRLDARSLNQVDAEGNQWSLTLRGGQTLARLQQRGKNPGPPLKVGVTVQRQAERAYIGLVVTGQAGEQYVGGARRNGKTLPPPTFEIFTRSGEIVGSGRFEYG